MRAIRVDKHIPLPNRIGGSGRPARYPWKNMNVGDSFVFPKEVKRSTAQSLTYKTGKTNGRRFAIRTVAEGIRCWRLA